MTEITVEFKSQADILTARKEGREMAGGLGFGTADQTRLATAISELVRNAIQYAGGGTCLIIDESDRNRITIRVVVEDNGPGILDIDKAMTDSFSTSQGLGAGLPGAKRLVNEFEIESEPGHTKVTIVVSRRRR